MKKISTVRVNGNMIFKGPAEFDRRDQVTATNSWPSSLREGGTEVENQVAAPTESSTPNLHRATIAQQRVRMEGWRKRRPGSMGNNLEKEGNKKEERQSERKALTLIGLLMEVETPIFAKTCNQGNNWASSNLQRTDQDLRTLAWCK